MLFIVLIIRPIGIWFPSETDSNKVFFCSTTFNIITTNKNKTATAPTYTINIIIPKNSAPIIMNKHDMLIKSKIKKKTE